MAFQHGFVRNYSRLLRQWMEERSSKEHCPDNLYLRGLPETKLGQYPPPSKVVSCVSAML